MLNQFQFLEPMNINKPFDLAKVLPNQAAFNTDLNKTLDLLQKDRYFCVQENGLVCSARIYIRIREKIREILGFVNKTSKTSLEYRTIQFLVYGAQNKWIDHINIERIHQLAGMILKNQPPAEEHLTLSDLVIAVNKALKHADLEIDFKEFGKVYFRSHPHDLSKRSFKVMCTSFCRKICHCFSNKVKQDQINKKQEKQELDLIHTNIDRQIEKIRLRKVEIADYEKNEKERKEKLEKDLNIIKQYGEMKIIDQKKKNELIVQKWRKEEEKELKETIQLFQKVGDPEGVKEAQAKLDILQKEKLEQNHDKVDNKEEILVENKMVLEELDKVENIEPGEQIIAKAKQLDEEDNKLRKDYLKLKEKSNEKIEFVLKNVGNLVEKNYLPPVVLNLAKSFRQKQIEFELFMANDNNLHNILKVESMHFKQQMRDSKILMKDMIV